MDDPPTTEGSSHGTDDAQARRDAKIEVGKAGVRRYLEQFQATYKQLSDAARMFREELSITYRECAGVVEILQALRQQTNACLEFFNSGEGLFPDLSTYVQVTNSLHYLDGEKTARLILEVDLFQSLVSSTRNEYLSQAKQRIDLHVTLQSRLKDEVKSLRELLDRMEQLLTVQAPPIPCSTISAD